ncbi:MAG TPA: phytanoyl-CoA dioxygenase family protein [Armatimonadota bacterium]|nr:phytanoyl-CoA dioxygenase family protein [Armatimonadota bacterium]
MQPLNDDQVKEYQEQGFILVSGLIPDEIAAVAEAQMWNAVGVNPDDPASWPQRSRELQKYEEEAVVAVYTPELLQAAAQLTGEDPASFRRPSRPFPINVFPRDGEWRWPGPHIDHAIKEHGHKTFPRAFRLASMTFLNDAAPHGGGTVVWPGSHQRIEALAKTAPDRYELMWTLNQELGQMELGAPLEIIPRRGDVLFYHYLCAHAGSMNTTARPRFALNMKW